jgi:hypothetical protein
MEFFQNNNSKRLDRAKKRLKKIISKKEIDNLCQKQEVIVQLQKSINQREQQIYQIIINISQFYLEKIIKISEFPRTFLKYQM